MDKIKNIFSRPREEASRNVLWFFGLPMIYVLYFSLSLFVPSFGSSRISKLFFSLCLYALLFLSFIIVTKGVLKVPLSFFLKPDDGRERSSFSFSMFFKGLAAMVFSLTVLTTADILLFKDSYSFTFNASDVFPLWIPVILLLAVAALDEELLFRAYICHFGMMKCPETAKGKITLCFVSGLIFTAAHFMNPETAGSLAVWYMASYFLMGFSFMMFYIKGSGIEYPLGVHLGNNLFTALLCTYSGSVLGDTNPLFTQNRIFNPSQIVIQCALSVLFCAFVLRRFKTSEGNPSGRAQKREDTKVL